MSVFLTPELRPFLGGTYFPPADAYGRPGKERRAMSGTSRAHLKDVLAGSFYISHQQCCELASIVGLPDIEAWEHPAEMIVSAAII